MGEIIMLDHFGLKLEYDCEDGSEILVFSGRASGCGCCSHDVMVGGEGDMLDWLDFQEERYSKQASWARQAASLLREHGESVITDTLTRLGNLSTNLLQSGSVLDSIQRGCSHKLPFSMILAGESKTDTLRRYMRNAKQGYSTLSVLDRQLGEHFAKRKMEQVAETINHLESQGYYLDWA